MYVLLGCIVILCVCVLGQAVAVYRLSRDNIWLRDVISRLSMDCAEMQEKLRIISTVKKVCRGCKSRETGNGAE